MKILLYNTYFRSEDDDTEDASHLATSLAKLCDALAKRGHKIAVISRRVKGTKSKAEINGINIHRTWFIDFPVLRIVTWFFTAMLQYPFLKEKPDIIVCWDWSTVFPALLPAKIHGIPVICSVRGKSKGLAKTIAFDLCDFIIYSSEWARLTVKTKSKGIVLHHGVDMNHFDFKKKPFKKFSKLTIGFFGRLHASKGVADLISAFHLLDPKTFKALIVGDGEEKEKLFRLSGDLDIDFLGLIPYSKVPNVMASADIIILPSYEEGFSSIILEAMAMKRVIIASTVGSSTEIIRNWQTGLLFRPGNIEQLAALLRNLMEDNRKRSMISEKAYSFVKMNYEWNSIVRKWEDIFSSVKKHHKPSPRP